MATRKKRASSAPRIRIATRGSALALAQATWVEALCKTVFPKAEVTLQIYKTTGDKLQTAALSNPGAALPKGLFTKELEVALLNGEADLAVHSLKDLPTELPDGLWLGGVLEREDARDMLVIRETSLPAIAGQGFFPFLKDNALVATSSTRRRIQMLARRPDLRMTEIRGNVGTRLKKLAESQELDATLLAVAGLKRLGFGVDAKGYLQGPDVPSGLRAVVLELEEMLPCVGQAAIGLEVRKDDESANQICRKLSHNPTLNAVTAERSLLRGLGGGCQSPLAAIAKVLGDQLELRAVLFRRGVVRQAFLRMPSAQAEAAGQALAVQLLGSE